MKQKGSMQGCLLETNAFVPSYIVSFTNVPGKVSLSDLLQHRHNKWRHILNLCSRLSELKFQALTLKQMNPSRYMKTCVTW